MRAIFEFGRDLLCHIRACFWRDWQQTGQCRQFGQVALGLCNALDGRNGERRRHADSQPGWDGAARVGEAAASRLVRLIAPGLIERRTVCATAPPRVRTVRGVGAKGSKPKRAFTAQCVTSRTPTLRWDFPVADITALSGLFVSAKRANLGKQPVFIIRATGAQP